MKKLALFLLQLSGYRGMHIGDIIFMAHKDSYKDKMKFQTKFFCDGDNCAISVGDTKLFKARKVYKERVKLEME